jgi:hypothetical protein
MWLGAGPRRGRVVSRAGLYRVCPVKDAGGTPSQLCAGRRWSGAGGTVAGGNLERQGVGL